MDNVSEPILLALAALLGAITVLAILLLLIFRVLGVISKQLYTMSEISRSQSRTLMVVIQDSIKALALEIREDLPQPVSSDMEMQEKLYEPSKSEAETSPQD